MALVKELALAAFVVVVTSYWVVVTSFDDFAYLELCVLQLPSSVVMVDLYLSSCLLLVVACPEKIVYSSYVDWPCD